MTENQENGKNILAEYRDRHGLSIADMANMAGVKYSTMAAHVYGTRRAKAGSCQKYARSFKMKLNDVIESIGSAA